eukprot:2134731-Amphidinium_carterae.1
MSKTVTADAGSDSLTPGPVTPSFYIRLQLGKSCLHCAHRFQLQSARVPARRHCSRCAARTCQP